MPIVAINEAHAAPDGGDQLPNTVAPRTARPRVRPKLSATSDESTTDTSNYQVGYGRPPAHTRFKPGQSGNPRGRPKNARGLNTLAREILTKRVPVRTGSGEKKMQRIEAVLHKAFELALKGNPRAQSQILGLYASAVPETNEAECHTPAEELTPTDLAVLEELKDALRQEAGL